MMTSCIEMITPDVAKKYLDMNMSNNRRVSKDTVNRYARVMRNGSWVLTHQGIAFDEHGKLIDGQHRLRAVITANVPVQMMVTRGVSHDDCNVLVMDTGKKRSTLNIMEISGFGDEIYKSSIHYVGQYLRYKVPNGSHRDSTEIIDYVGRHYNDIATAIAIINSSKRSSSTKAGSNLNGIVGGAIISAVYRGESRDALEKFVRVYTKNDVFGCEKYNPRHALNLRDWLRNNRSSGESFLRCENAIYCFAHNIVSLRILDRYPFIQELDA